MYITLPNKFTFVRLLLITPILILLYIGGLWFEILAILIFIIAAITDYLDGYFARKFNASTDLGKIFDHSADKGLITSVLILLVYLHKVDPFVVVIFVVRDLLVSGIRMSAAKNIVIAAGTFGKIKTGLQMCVIPFLMLDPSLIDFKIVFYLRNLAYYVLWVSAVFSIISGLEYLKVWSRAKKQ